MSKRGLVVVASLAILAAAAAFGRVSAQETQPPNDLFAMVTSGREADRAQAKTLVTRNREHDIHVLRMVVQRPISPGEQFYSTATPRNIAARLLGRIRAAEAVPDLIPLLIPQPGQGMSEDELMLLPSPAYALVEIGLPAVRPLINRLAIEEASPMRTECLRTLVGIVGPDGVEYYIGRAIQSETDSAKTKRLNDALKLLKKPGLISSGLANLHRTKYDLP